LLAHYGSYSIFKKLKKLREERKAAKRRSDDEANQAKPGTDVFKTFFVRNLRMSQVS
jgi:hypothetical protein